MKVTCHECGCDMKITSSFRYLCPECNNQIEMHWVQEKNKAYWEEHKKNIESVEIKGDEIIVAR